MMTAWQERELRICVTLGCGQAQPRKSQRGLCNRCYSRIRRNGTLELKLRPPKKPKPLKSRVWKIRSDQIEELFRGGVKEEQIGADLGVKATSVRRHLLRLGLVEPHRGPARWDGDKVATLIEMANDGALIRDIAEAVGKSLAATQSAVQKYAPGILRVGGRFKAPISERIESVSFERIANKVISPGIEKHLVPLLHFKGSADLGRVHRLWNLTLALKEHSVEVAGDAVALAHHPAFSHLCEPIRRTQHLGLYGFWSRLLLKPQVCDLEPGLLDWVKGIAPHAFQLQEVSQHTDARNHAWWRTYVPNRRSKEEQREAAALRSQPKTTELMWPFIRHDHQRPEDSGMALVRAVNAVVSNRIYEESRADICQDLIMAILEGKFTLEQVQGNPKHYISKVREFSPWKYEWVSIDQPMFGDGDRTLADVLPG